MQKYTQKPELKNVQSMGMMPMLSCQHNRNPACRQAAPEAGYPVEARILTQLSPLSGFHTASWSALYYCGQRDIHAYLPAAVLKHNLQKAGKEGGQKGKSVYRKHQKCWLYCNRETDLLQTTKLSLLGAEQNCTISIVSVYRAENSLVFQIS